MGREFLKDRVFQSTRELLAYLTGNITFRDGDVDKNGKFFKVFLHKKRKLNKNGGYVKSYALQKAN